MCHGPLGADEHRALRQAILERMTMLRSSIIVGMMVGGLMVSGACAAESTATITVDAGKIEGKASPYIFGQNISSAEGAGIFPSGTMPATIRTGTGVWDSEKKAGIPEVMRRMRAVGTTMLRYPGGCLSHNYDWRKSVGPLAQRGNPDWAFGLDEYLAFCREVGAEPMITISDYVLPAAEMPRHAADLVEYLNAPATPAHPWAMKRKEWGHAEPYGVKWFELGNESDHGNHEVKPARKFTPEEYGAYALATAKAMKAVDPTIKTGVVMVPGSGRDYGCLWNRTAIKMAGAVSDFVVIHIYTPDLDRKQELKSETELMKACMAVGEQVDTRIDGYHQMIRKECGRDLPLAVTEFNAGFVQDNPKPYRYSYGAALEVADLLRIFLKPTNQIVTANYWEFINGYWGMVQTDMTSPTGGAIREMPAFTLYSLWKNHFGLQQLNVSVVGPKATFAGDHGVFPAMGDAIQAEGKILRKLETVELLKSFTEKIGVNGCYTMSRGGEGEITLKFKELTGTQYPVIATISRGDYVKEPCDFRLSYEARYTGDAEQPTALVGMGLADARGWEKTRSAIEIHGTTGPEWRSHTGTLLGLTDAANIQVVARLFPKDKKLNGTLEIRHLKMELIGKTTFPSYALLTAASSLSDNGKTLYLMVINKSLTDPITATVQIKGFDAASAHYWEVNGPDITSSEGVRETVSNASLTWNAGALSHVFPAHSMTAIELTRKN